MKRSALRSANVSVGVSRLMAQLMMIVLAAAPARAQTPAAGAHIDGTVVDTQGLPIVGAEITLTRPQANLSRTATSSAERFRFDNLSPGNYTLRVTATGF